MLTTLSMLFGGLLRLMPEIMAFFNKRTDNAHELAMMDRQLQLDQARSNMRIHEAEIQGDINQQLALISAQGVALKAQMQKTGIRWVDAINFAVRPLTTYYFLICYGIVKTSMIVVALRTTDPWLSIIQCWSEQDAAILSGILAFWFVGRCFDKKQ